MLNIKDFISALNKRRKNTSAFVTRRRHEEVVNKYTVLKNAITSSPNPLTQPAKLTWIKPHVHPANELCSFVSFAKQPVIKSYVALHIQAFIDQGIDVLLVINTDHPELALNGLDQIPDVSAVCVRENIGFDFGAWSQMMRDIDTTPLHRLFWVNDSLFGPLNAASFHQMIASVRSSDADLLGLTENGTDDKHLQSFFYAFNHRMIHDDKFLAYVRNLWQLPTKSLVIEFYETRFTHFVHQLGFSHEAIFSLAGKENKELTYNFPTAMYEAGFPYVKTALIRDNEDEGLAARHLPQHLPID